MFLSSNGEIGTLKNGIVFVVLFRGQEEIKARGTCSLSRLGQVHNCRGDWGTVDKTSSFFLFFQRGISFFCGRRLAREFFLIKIMPSLGKKGGRGGEEIKRSLFLFIVGDTVVFHRRRFLATRSKSKKFSSVKRLRRKNRRDTQAHGFQVDWTRQWKNVQDEFIYYHYYYYYYYWLMISSVKLTNKRVVHQPLGVYILLVQLIHACPSRLPHLLYYVNDW